MSSKILRRFLQKQSVASCNIAPHRFFELNWRCAGELIPFCRVSVFHIAVVTIMLARLSAPGSAAARERGDRDSTLGVSATSLAFGNVSVNTTATQSVTLTSTGTAELTVRAAAISGSGFAVSGAAFPLNLSPGQTATLVVRFDPATAGAASGSLTVTSDSSSGRTTVIGLSGTGVSASSVATLSVNATTIAFGSVNLNSPATQSLTLTSTGTAAVTVSSETVSGAGFSVSGAAFPLTLTPNQTAVLSVQFDPTTAGTATGALSLSSNSSTGTTTTISLSGTGASSSYDVNLTWNAPSSSPDPVAGYNVYRAPNGSSSYQLLNSSPDSQTNYSDATAQGGQTYQYYVESVDSSGNASVPSNTASVTVP
jgi:hypothetical protein